MCDTDITAEQVHVAGFWRIGRAEQRRHLLDAHQVDAPRPGGTDLIALHAQSHEDAALVVACVITVAVRETVIDGHHRATALRHMYDHD